MSDIAKPALLGDLFGFPSRELYYDGITTVDQFRRLFEPQDEHEWRARNTELVVSLRNARPCAWATYLTINDQAFYSLEGVMLALCRSVRWVEGEWVEEAEFDISHNPYDSDRLMSFESHALARLRPSDAQRYILMTDSSAPLKATRYTFDSMRPTEDLKEMLSPMEAWWSFGFRTDDLGGTHPEYWDLTAPIQARSVPSSFYTKYQTAIYTGEKPLKMNDAYVAQGVNPLKIFADFIEASLERPDADVWSDHIANIAARR